MLKRLTITILHNFTPIQNRTVLSKNLKVGKSLKTGLNQKSIESKITWGPWLLLLGRKSKLALATLQRSCSYSGFKTFIFQAFMTSKDFISQEWNHFCIAYSTITKRLVVMLNGYLEVDHTRPEMVKEVSNTSLQMTEFLQEGHTFHCFEHWIFADWGLYSKWMVQPNERWIRRWRKAENQKGTDGHEEE